MARLGDLPSAREGSWHETAHGGMHRASRWVGGLAVLLLLLFVAGLGAVYWTGFGSIGVNTLQAQAQERISRALGRPVSAVIGSTGLSLDKSLLVALDVNDVDIGLTGAGSALTARRLSFGIRPSALLRGKLELGHARVVGAAIDASGMSGAGRGLPPGLLDENGVIVPDLIVEAVFGALTRLEAALGAGDTDRLEIAETTITLGAEGPFATIEIIEASLSRVEKELLLEAEIRAADRTFTLAGTTMTESATPAADNFSLSVTGSAPDRDLTAEPLANALGAFELVLRGGGPPSERFLSARLDASQAGLRIGWPDPVPLSGRLRARLVEGSGKVEFEQIAVANTRTSVEGTGAIGPIPRDEREDWQPGYRYEFVSGRSFISPADSNEPGMQAAVKVSGRIEPDFSAIRADELAVGSDEGAVFGTAAVLFEAGKQPGVELALNIPQLTVRQGKSIWPWFAAPGARSWVMKNLYGGTIEASVIRLKAEPGFFGRGVPLDAERLQAEFAVRGTRFDVAGAIPPVRDAVGKLEIRGMSIDIALESGTVFLPSGRSVDAKDGSLRILDASHSPLIGEVDVDVSGEAGGIVEIASYDPIDVSRFITLAPEDLQGRVSGNVTARVPLQANVPSEELSWRVDLDYEGLSIAKPFEGQMVTEAAGKIVAEPASTSIRARARLNGMPAEIDMFEPLGEDKSARRRSFRVDLDDKAREAMLPGLSTILAGPVTVDLAMTGEGTGQNMVADLGRARVSLPWVGWSKGAGVPATATFRLETEEGRTRISDFSLRGESFGATGSMVLDSGGLTSARFSNLRLNRSDEASLSLDRSGSRYDITVKGKSLDVRSLIKTFNPPASGAPAAVAASPMRVRVDATLDAMAGFHGETLSAVQISYSGSGSKIDSLRASAKTRSGAHFAIVDAEAGGNRRIELQAGDAGAVLRFLDIYQNLQGGSVALSLAGPDGGALRGHIEALNFAVNNEQRLNTIVESAPSGGNRSLNDAVRRDIDVSQSQFDRGFARLEKGEGYLTLTEGVVRGPMIGSTFQGTLFDQTGDMNITGTFMPAYGLNRIFGEIPIIGQILGNGRDRGLIGITYRLTGKASEPKVQVNPLSVVAPGIFRSIFEYR